jgi:flagellar hook-basal body complex protein FliE
MVMPIKGSALPMPELASARIGGAGSIKSPGVGPVKQEGTTDFASTLRNALSEVNDQQVKAEKVSEDYASGKQNDLHGTMITMTEADVQLRLVANVRNKVIEAYREVMRMGS